MLLAEGRTGAVIMFGFGSRQKLQMAQMALQEALAQLENTIRERDAYLQQRDIAIGERNLALAEIERLKRQAQNPE
jgi:multidrug resistance efflux pump